MWRILLILIFAVCGCGDSLQESNHGAEEELQSTISIFTKSFNNRLLVDSLTESLYAGNLNSYAELRDIYFLSDHQNEFLLYSIYMVNKHDYQDAIRDIEFILGLQGPMKNSDFTRILLKCLRTDTIKE